MSLDPLSQILAAFDVRGAAFTRLEAGGSWALRFAPKPLIKFNAVVRGQCWLALGGAAPRRLAAGDVFLLANAPAYTVASDPRLPAADGSALFARAAGGTVTYGGDAVVLIGGAFTVGDAGGDPLPAVLPAFLRIDTAAPGAARVRETLARLELELAARELGASLVAHRLAEILLVDMLRAHAAQGGEAQGWLAALRDRRVGAALAAMHDTPGRGWTVGELARVAGMSRSGFARRFRQLTGASPLDHLLRWRMRLARAALRRGERSVSRLSLRLGYTSDSAFSNAFKRVHGCSPRRWRPDEAAPGS